MLLFEVVRNADVSFAVLIAGNKLLCVVSFRDTVCSQLVTIQHYHLVAKPFFTGADLGGGCRECAAPRPEMTCGFLKQLVFCKKKKNYVVYWC